MDPPADDEPPVGAIPPGATTMLRRPGAGAVGRAGWEDRRVGLVSTVRGDALGDDDACGLLERLARREVSAAELRKAALARARDADAVLNAVTVWVDEAPAADVQVRVDAPFAGIPSVVKDTDDLTGYPTSQGSWAVPDRPAPACSPWVAQFLGLGFTPVAKTTLPEFGLTASTESSRFGATRNPWDTSRSVGGSSGGSAALVAAGAVPLAHANDGGGSIRIPAACCGIVGLKPTRGRLVDSRDLRLLPVRLPVQGVLTRSVRDTAHYYAEAEKCHRRPALPEVGLVEGPADRRLRIGVAVTGTRGLPVSPGTVAAVRGTAELCARFGHHVEEVEVPIDDTFGPDFLRYWGLLALVIKRRGSAIYGAGFDGSRTEPLTTGLSRMVTAQLSRLPGSLRRLRRLAREHEQLYERVDVLLSPVTGHEAPPIGYLGPGVDFRTHLVRLLRFTSFTPLQNVSGSPAISLPLGRSPDGLPIGVQVGAPFGHERRLLELAYELEAASPWPTTPGSSPA
jgi:amidase